MLFVGGMIPVVFSALAMNSVGKAAMDMVYEVRRQFKEIPGIMEGTGKPEYGKCVEISTKAALREMMLPGIMTIGFPIAIVLLGKLVYGDNNQLIAEMLGGYMAGVTVSGVLWAVFQNNAGGAWDNAKKSFEAGVMINGEMTYKGSDAHKAAVTGDTVGDPFKDTSGPSMNILIKLTCLIGLVIAPILGNGHSENTKAACCSEGKTEMTFAPQSVTLTLEDDIDISRGDMIVRKNNVPTISQDVDIMICWLGNAPMRIGGKYIIRHTSSEARCIIKEVKYKININTLDRDFESKNISSNDIARITIRTTKPLFFDSYRKNRNTGSLVLIDEATNVTICAGMIV